MSFYIRPARLAPYREIDRMTPALDGAAVPVPAPFDIKHTFQMPAGRSTGGYYYLNFFERMDWVYGASGAHNYQSLLACFNPLDPFRWVYFADPYSGVEAWWEGSMSEPRVTRGVGATVTEVLLSFHHLYRYP